MCVWLDSMVCPLITLCADIVLHSSPGSCCCTIPNAGQEQPLTMLQALRGGKGGREVGQARGDIDDGCLLLSLQMGREEP